MQEPVWLEVNGERRRIEADPGTPLLSVLRNELGLTGAKYGCGLEQCYACAVIVDGEAVATCVAPVASFAGRAITTVEGLAGGDGLHPVQEAFVAESAGQCGYCIPGLVVGVAALLRRNGRPTDDEIRQALAPHLCRCGAHASILRAVRRAAHAMAAAAE